MSAESELRAALVAVPALTAVVPASRISVDAVEQGLTKPYIAFVSQGYADDVGLNNAPLASATTIDIQCVGIDRANATQVRDLVREAIRAAGFPSDRGSSGYDPDNDLEVEIVTVDWFDV